jgi:hypothetical protein
VKRLVFVFLAFAVAGCYRDRDAAEALASLPLSRDDHVRETVVLEIIRRFPSEPVYFISADAGDPRDPIPALLRTLQARDQRVRPFSDAHLGGRTTSRSDGREGAIVAVSVSRWISAGTAEAKGEYIPGALSGGTLTCTVHDQGDSWAIERASFTPTAK